MPETDLRQGLIPLTGARICVIIFVIATTFLMWLRLITERLNPPMTSKINHDYADTDESNSNLTYNRLIEHMIRAFFSSRNIDTVIYELLKSIVSDTDLDRIYIFEKVKDTELTRTHYFSKEEGFDYKRHVSVPFHKNGWHSAAQKESFYFADDTAIPPFSTELEGDVLSDGLKSYAQAPLLIGDTQIGMIQFGYCRRTHHWTKTEKRMITDLTVFLSELVSRKKMEEQLSHSNTVMTTILDALDSFVYVVEHPTHKLLFANATLRKHLRGEYSAEKTCWELIRPDMGAPCPFCKHDTLFDKNGNPSKTVQKEDLYDEFSGLWLDVSSTPINWIDGKKAVLMVCRDITARKKAEQTLLYKNKIHNFALGNAKGFTWEVDITTDIIQVSPTTEESIGYQSCELSGPVDRFMKIVRHSNPNSMRQALKDYTNGRADDYFAEHTMYTSDGSLKWFLTKGRFLDKNSEMVCGVSIDITERKLFEERLAERAYKDNLTGLYNMQYLTDNLLMPLQSFYHSLGAMILDIRSFKNINEAFGHEYGDRLLVTVVFKFRELVPENPILRVSGDRFLIVFDDITIEEIEGLTKRMLGLFSDPLVIEGKSVQVNFKIGIALSTENERDIVQLLKDAEIALYNAKRSDVSDYCLLNDVLRATFGNKVNMELELQKAVRQKDFLMYYQPKVSLKKNAVVGAEALVRWKHKKHGMIPPLDFISLAEETGQIIPIGEFVIAEVTKQIRRWRDEGYDFFVSFNISAKQFLSPTLTRTIKQWVEYYEIPPSSLAVEITENIMILDFAHVKKILDELRAYGVKVFLDDFGTGYSSMSYLGKMPIDNIKIDKSFLVNALANQKEQAILNAIILLAHDLELLVTAEGVETKEQLSMLEGFGCDLIQGYFFSKPLPPEKLENMIKEWSEHP